MRRKVLQTALIILTLVACAAFTRAQNQEDERIAIGTNLVSVNVTVTDSRGRHVEGLRRENFEVFDNQARRPIAYFSSEDAPFSIGIIYDMHSPVPVRAENVLRALKQFSATLRPEDELFFLCFNERGSLAVDFVPTFEQVSTQLSVGAKENPTSLYDAIYTSTERVRAARHAKKALLIISDGEDHNSRRDFKLLREQVSRFGLQLYAIAIADTEDERRAGHGRWMFEDLSRESGRRTLLEGSDAALGRAVLNELARMSGGKAFVPEINNELELAGVCTQIGLELRRQYAISFYPAEGEALGKWHRIRINVTSTQSGVRLSASYKEGYQLSQR